MERYNTDIETYQKIDKYDLRVIQIVWFLFGFLAAVIAILGTLNYYGYVR